MAHAGSVPEFEGMAATLESLPFGLVLLDSERRIRFINERGRKLCPDDSLPPLLNPSSEVPIPEEKTPWARAFRGLASEGEQYAIRRRRGQGAVWIECGARPSSGGVLFFFTDITGRKKREFEDESARQLRDFIYRENISGIIHTSVDGCILDCNEAILRMWGYSSREELFALRMPQLYFDPADRDQILRRMVSSSRISEFEVCFRRKDGSRCWALMNARLLDAPRGQVGGSIVAAVIDITERKTQEETLRQSEQRFSAFMRHLPGIAFIKDLRGRYVYYNEAVRTLFQKPPEELVGKSDFEIWPEEQAAQFKANDGVVVSRGRPFECVETVVHADGPHSWLMYKFPIMEAGKVVLVGSVGIDITERTILEGELTQARKMDALGRLAGGVAHDFNNLLTVMSGYSQMALEGAGEVSDDQMIGYLQEILNSARRASALTGQLLSFSRRQAVNPIVVDLGDLLREMERLLQRVIGEHVELTVKTSAAQCLVLADPHQMEQVILNLAVNARDAMPLGGSLDISCERLEMPVDPLDDPECRLSILMEIRDTGIGMDEQVKPRIFDPFYTSKQQGTGLGLSMVYGIVSQSKGRIQVDSAPGEGTVFRIYFPEAQRALDRKQPQRPPGATHGTETVLLVEDEPTVRALAEAILKRIGYRVQVADCGPAALAMWEQLQGKVDVLLTDVIMPQMSGGELAHKLRDRNPALKVLFMSGYTDDMIRSHGALIGETQLIQKPFTAEALGRRLRDVLDA